MSGEAGVKVLLIDDSAIVRRVLRRTLRDDSQVQHLFEASNAADGYSLFKICQPEIVVLDLDLPDLHGLEILKKIKRRAPLCVVIIVTSSDSAETRDACFSCGADLFVSKGANVRNVAGMIAGHCRSVRPRMKLIKVANKRAHEKIGKSRSNPFAAANE